MRESPAMRPDDNQGNPAGFALLPSLSAVPVRATGTRFLVLGSTACFMFGNYYFFDQTSATEQPILDTTGMSEKTFGILSSVYSWPNVILPLLGGMFIDRMGVRIAALFFTVLVLIGSILFTLGLSMESTNVLILARVIFGMGGESQNVANLTFISKWFVGKELAFAMAITVAVSRLGSVAVLDSQPALVKSMGVTEASAVTSIICGVSLCSCILACVVDKYADRKDTANGFALSSGDVDAAASCGDIRKLSTLYWLVSLSCVAVYVAAFPFIQVVSAPYLDERFGYNASDADKIASAINLTSAFLSPLLGLCVDKFGRRPMLIVFSAASFVVCHLTFMLFPVCIHCWSIIPVYIFMGAALSVYGSVIWPCIPLVVDREVTGTAFGITTSVQNAGMALSPMVLTQLHSSTGSWTLPFCYIIACCSIGSAAGIVIWILDRRSGGKLSSGSSSAVDAGVGTS